MVADSAAIVRTGILHVGEMDAAAAAAIVATLREAGLHPVVQWESSAQSQRNWIFDVLCRWCDEEELDLVITVGGTRPAPGPSAREIVPEATADAIERDLPGLSEAMRAYAADESDLALLDRGRTGIRGRSLLVNLPAGAGAASLFLEAVAHLVGPVLAHLQDQEDAPSVSKIHRRTDNTVTGVADLDAGSGADVNPDRDIDRHGATPHTAPSHKIGLSESEFAAFLHRSDKEKTGDE